VASPDPARPAPRVPALSRFALSRFALSRFERFAIAHVVAYPIAFLWAVGSIPLAIHLFSRELMALQDDMQAVGQSVVHRVAWPAGAAFALVHLLALPWALVRTPGPLTRRTWAGIAGVAALGLVGGASGWLWLLVR
jgi:hypothetical protein